MRWASFATPRAQTPTPPPQNNANAAALDSALPKPVDTASTAAMRLVPALIVSAPNTRQGLAL